MALSGVVRRLTDDELADLGWLGPPLAPLWTLGTGTCAGGCARALLGLQPLADAVVAALPHDELVLLLLERREAAGTCADCRQASFAARRAARATLRAELPPTPAAGA